jgi:hypothetical protein
MGNGIDVYAEVGDMGEEMATAYFTVLPHISEQ